MCGILAIFSKNGELIQLPKKCDEKYIKTIRELAYQQSKYQRHRGPDHTGIIDISENGVAVVQERLAILFVETGDQPLTSTDDNIIMAANGEIYNYLELSAEIAKHCGKYVPRSDCDLIIGLYVVFGKEYLFNRIAGMFSFVLYDKLKKELLIGRDPIGIIPLYKGEDEFGNIWFSSEMKCLVNVCAVVNAFPPGTYLTGPIDNLQTIQYYQPKWITEIPTARANLTLLRQQLESAVHSHLQCDVPFGALLSGGIDSSLIASIATKIMREKQPNYRLKTYSIGLENAPDFKYGRMVADYINSEHREIIFKIRDGLDCVRDIIYHTETYDVTTVRCSIPMFILARSIKAEGIKMILSGEGSDELFGGYLYFFNAPTMKEFHEETVKRVLNLQYTDCLRANKITCAWGLELRVPFLDTSVINYIMSICPEDRIPGTKNRFGSNYNNNNDNSGCHRQHQQQQISSQQTSSEQTSSQQTSCIEKYILRAAFTDSYLPNEVIWRQKEQFSDGVGYSWIDTLRSYISDHITDEEFENAKSVFPFNTPTTKEAFYYRKIFTDMFPGEQYAKTVNLWIPRKDWGCAEDPSGRAQKVHSSVHI